MSELTSQPRRSPVSTRVIARTARTGAGTWRWLYASKAGVAIEGPAVRFRTETAAQQWLDRNADALLRQRIAWVSLLDGEHVVDSGEVVEFAGRR